MKRDIENGLDRIGWAILGALQDNARLSFAELGRRVGLTAPAAAERVRQMEDAGILRGYRAEIGLERLGLAVDAVIRVSAPEEKCPALKACVKTLPEVVERRFGTPTTSIILSSPVSARAVAEPPVSWPLARSTRRAPERGGVSTRR